MQKKRDKYLNKKNYKGKLKGIPKGAIFGSPPEFVMGKADRYGFMQKLVKRALTLSDKDISVTSKFMNSFTKASTLFTDKISSLRASPNNKLMFNLNNITMWGLSEEGGIPFRLKKEQEDVVIVGEAIINNVQHYKVKYKDTGKTKTVPVDELNASDTDIKKAIISLYRDELTNEIMDGQTRLLVPSVIDKKINTIEDEAGVTDEVDKDYQRLKAKIKHMAEERKTEDSDKAGNRVGGVHTITKRIDGKLH